MKKPISTLNQIVTRTKALERIESFRLGSIVKTVVEKNQIWIDFDENPFRKPILAKLGSPWISSDELKLFLDKVDSVKLEFLDGNPSQPIIRDLFFSVNDLNRAKVNPNENKVIEVEADEIIFKGRKQITLQSGNAKTILKAEGSEIIQEADRIDSSVETNIRIKGGTVLLN
jgi:hypothetical protein